MPVGDCAWLLFDAGFAVCALPFEGVLVCAWLEGGFAWFAGWPVCAWLPEEGVCAVFAPEAELAP